MSKIHRVQQSLGALFCRRRRQAQAVMLAAIFASLVACGGGGGGGGGSNARPNASFTASPASGQAPITISVDGSASNDSDGSISTYAWDFGDGGTATGATATHDYTAGDNFTITLTVTDNDGATDTATRTVNIAAPTGDLAVTVVDQFDAPVAGASVSVTVDTSTLSGTTDDAGEVLVADVPTGSASVEVSRATFASQTLSTTITANETTNLDVTLVRNTQAAGGSLTSRSGNDPVVTNGGQTMTFEIEIIVVDQDSNPITGLTVDDFSLAPCTTVAVPQNIAECVRGINSSFDAAYTPTSANPSALVEVPPANTPVPYAAALMLDQSGSVGGPLGTDPTGARLFSSKAFLSDLGTEDRALLTAFADDGENQVALIPTKPLTTYGPFRSSSTLDDDPAYFATLDGLAALTGGGTPLYRALDELIPAVASDATVPAANGRAVVVFTDGDDTECSGPNPCRTARDEVITLATANQVRVFSIGLSNDVNIEALGELATGTEGAFLFAENAEQLVPLYGTLGRLLSLSLPTYRLTWTVETDVADAFVSRHALLGRVTVTTAAGTIEVPIVVGVP